MNRSHSNRSHSNGSHSNGSHSSRQHESHEAFYRKMQRRLHRIRKGIEELSSKRALVKSTRQGAGEAPDFYRRRAFRFEETAQGRFRLTLN